MINDIRLQHFRSYTDTTLEFGEGVNIIVGPNASGKTNLLEAIQVIAQGNSYRAQPAELIQLKRKWAKIDAHTNSGVRSVRIDAREERLKKTYEINKQTLMRLPLNKTMPLVLFEPEHLQLLTGRPELRREYLDTILEQTISGYGKLRRDYKRALAQRNALLKQNETKGINSSLFAWNVRLSELGGQIVRYRQDLVQNINTRLPKLYKKLSRGDVQIAANYVSSCLADNYENDMLKKLEANMENDYKRGFTAYGPHRDDLQILANNNDIQEVASRGEIRTVLLGLKIVELTLIENARDQRPILLLDDVFSELDGARRRALTKFLKDYQTFITTTDADIVVQHFMDNCTIIPTSS